MYGILIWKWLQFLFNVKILNQGNIVLYFPEDLSSQHENNEEKDISNSLAVYLEVHQGQKCNCHLIEFSKWAIHEFFVKYTST